MHVNDMTTMPETDLTTTGMVDVTMRCVDTGMGRPLTRCTNKEIGRYGEDLAASYLERRGYEILRQNWRCDFGEADIVAKDGSELVLVEVKTRLCRMDDTWTAPELAVDARKRAKYEKMALMCYAKQAEFDSVRFDVIAIKLLGEHDISLRHLYAAYVWDR